MLFMQMNPMERWKDGWRDGSGVEVEVWRAGGGGGGGGAECLRDGGAWGVESVDVVGG